MPHFTDAQTTSDAADDVEDTGRVHDACHASDGEEERKPVRVALVQAACGEDRNANIDQGVQAISDAARQGAQIVCLQELFATPYPCQAERHERFEDAESLEGPICRRLQAVAKELKLVIVGSFFERRAAGLFHNSAVVFDPGGRRLGHYRKIHIPDDPHYYEKFYFTPGENGPQVVETPFGRIGLGICWDQWFPEHARLLSLAGAELIVYPTSIGWLINEKQDWGASQYGAWETMLRSHAIANGVYVAAANRVGIEGAIEFWGASVAADPFGNLIARGSHDQPGVVQFEFDRACIETARTHWPFLRDRRIDGYQDLTRRYLD